LLLCINASPSFLSGAPHQSLVDHIHEKTTLAIFAGQLRHFKNLTAHLRRRNETHNADCSITRMMLYSRQCARVHQGSANIHVATMLLKRRCFGPSQAIDDGKAVL
jgi:hypothetical protein